MARISAGLVTLTLALASQGAWAQTPAPAGASGPSEWLTWGYDPERSGWNTAETKLTKQNVGKLKVQWEAKLGTSTSMYVLSTTTAPVVAAGVPTSQGTKDLLFILGADDVVTALDANSGATVWSKSFPNPKKPQKQRNWLCSDTANATPTIDKERGLLFVMASDGMLRALSLGDGTEKMKPTEMVLPFARAWSLNLFDNVVYTTSGRACGEVTDPRSPWWAAIQPLPRRAGAPEPSFKLDPSAVTAIDVLNLDAPEVTRFYTSGNRPAAAWGRGGGARGPGNSFIIETSDGLFDPGSGFWSDTILKLAPKATRVADSYTPENHVYIGSKDLGGSASPVVFTMGNKTLVAVSQKEGVLRILDANNLGGGKAANHAKPLYQSGQLGNDAATGTDPSAGVWGAITTYLTPDNRRFLYVPMWGAPSKHAPVFPSNSGPIQDGSIMAFEVKMDGDKLEVIPRWTSPNMIMPDPPVVANGVLYATSTGGQVLQNPTRPDGTRITADNPISATKRTTPVSNLTLYALDATTGKVLYNSKKTIPGWVHFGEPVVALGKVFLTTYDARVYAFSVNGK